MWKNVEMSSNLLELFYFRTCDPSITSEHDLHEMYPAKAIETAVPTAATVRMTVSHVSLRHLITTDSEASWMFMAMTGRLVQRHSRQAAG